MDSWLYLYGPPELFVTLSDREDKEMGITSVARESYFVVARSSGSVGYGVEEYRFPAESSLREWLKERYARCPDRLGDDLRRGYLYIYRGRKVTPKIRKVTIDEIDLSW